MSGIKNKPDVSPLLPEAVPARKGKIDLEVFADLVGRGWTNTQLADHFKVHRSSISRAHERLAAVTTRYVVNHQGAAERAAFGLESVAAQLNDVAFHANSVLEEVRGPAMIRKLEEAAAIAVSGVELTDSQQARLDKLVVDIRAGYTATLKACDTKLKLVNVAADAFSKLIALREIKAAHQLVLDLLEKHGISRREFAGELEKVMGSVNLLLAD